MLSIDQERAIGGGDASFSWVECKDRPVPSWVEALHIDWMLGFDNSPRIILKTTRPFDWPEAYVYKNGYWTNYSGDGRMVQFYHGSLDLEWADGLWQTRREDGFAGGGFRLKMAAGSGPRSTLTGEPVWFEGGETVLLCGPWYSVPLDGWFSVPIHESQPNKGKWYEDSLTYGLNISEELLLGLIAHFTPTVRVARVTLDGVTTLDPVKSVWPAPKQFLRNGARQ